jgi:predicted small metal-binding protein
VYLSILKQGGQKMASFKCKDMGMKCGFEVKDENQDEMMEIIALHAKKSHNMTQLPPDMVEKVKKAIKK